MLYAKNYNHYGKWKAVYMSSDEIERAQKMLQELNKVILKDCLKDARQVLQHSKIRPTDKRVTEVAVALLSLNGLKSFTCFEASLDEQVRQARVDPHNYESADTDSDVMHEQAVEATA